MEASITRRLVRHTVALTLAQLLRIAMSTLLSLVVAYRLGVTGLGQYALLNAYGPVFQTLALLGIPRLLVRELARGPGHVRSFFQAAFVAQSMGSVVSALGFIVIVQFLHYTDEMTWGLILLAFSLLPFGLAALGESVLQAEERMDLMAIQQISGVSVQVAGSLWLLYQGYGVVALASMMLLGNCVNAGVSLFFLRRHQLWLPFGFDVALIGQVLRQTLDFFLMSLSVVIFAKLDIMMLSLLMNERAVGIYNAAFLVIQVINQAAMSFTNAIYPILARLFQRGQAAFVAFLTKILRFVAIGAALIMLVLISQAPLIIHLLYPKEDYTESAWALAALAPFAYIFLLNAIMGHGLMAANLQRRSVVIASVRLVAALVLYPLLIRWQGVIGAALATGLAALVGTVLNAYFLAKELALPALGGFHLKLIGLTLLYLLLLWPLRAQQPFLFAVILLVGYGPLLLLTRLVPYAEVSQFGQLLRTLRRPM
ncbi:MAG: oligosaccharide flippase family protein [Caldilineaceae bacterium]|nr:oligosaccharide flippase family protein [Caldilineaceae bacterium]